MGGAGPRRAVADAPASEAPSLGRRVSGHVVDGLLWMLGGLGLLSLIAAVAAHVFGFSIVLFSTGSMTPTIPAGSAALVRLLPATEFHVGDVTTVERQNLLPITHRITSIKLVDGTPSARLITMRGDANDTDDPEPYLIHNARLVVASVPGVATAISGMRNPLLMLATSLVVGGLVTWVFWPRQARKASLVAAVTLVAATQLLGATDAQAAETEHQVVGRHIVLTVVSDTGAMSTMVPGVPVLWQVGIATRGEEEGELHIGLGLSPDAVNADALEIDVLACPARWNGDTCSGVAQTWVSASPLDEAFVPFTNANTKELGRTAAATPMWILVRATLRREAPEVRTTLTVAAWGGGELVDAESDSGTGSGDGGLASTGPGGWLGTLTLAGGAIGSGLVVAWLAGRRRPAEDSGAVR